MNSTETFNTEAPRAETGTPGMLIALKRKISRYAVPRTELKKSNPEAGYSIGELLVYSGIFAAGIAAVAGAAFAVTNLMNSNFAKREINQIVQAATSYRQMNNDYTGLSGISVLVNNGYGLAGFTDGDEENTFGLDMTAATHASNADAKITYTFPNDALCEQAKKWVEEKVSEYKSTNTSCNGTTHLLDFVIN